MGWDDWHLGAVWGLVGNRNWNCLKEMDWEVVNWIDLAQDMDSWRTVMNTVMTLRVP